MLKMGLVNNNKIKKGLPNGKLLARILGEEDKDDKRRIIPTLISINSA